jgi:hypothetical protein
MKRFNTKIKDAKLNIRIRIKPEDIKGAVCRDHEKCVVAKAIKRQLKARFVNVGANTVLVGTGKFTAKRFLLNSVAREQIRYFDTNDGAFAPCKVSLVAPYSKGKIGSRTGKNARSGKNKAKKARKQPTR